MADDHSGATTSVSVPLYVPATALESPAERRMMMRLPVLAGPELQVCWVAELTWPVSGTFGVRSVPEACPGVLFHATSNAIVLTPDESSKLPPPPDPVAVTW